MRLLLFLLIAISPALSAQGIDARFQAVNSGYDELNPVLSPDGQTLYFTVANHPSNTGGIKDPGDIWFARMEGGRWSAPAHGGTAINDKAYNAVAGFSPDGRQLFLHGHYGSPGNIARTQGISVSREKGGTWARPDNINIPYFMNKSGALCGSLSADNTVFVFSAESYGTYGVDDIYVTRRKDGGWTEPENVGRTINTQFQELSPFISDDLKTLYFSSNGLQGRGSFDVYSAQRLDETWTRWSTPKNLGGEINTEGRELFYRFYPASGFALFTTTASSDGYGDLRVFTPPVANDTAIFASIDDAAQQAAITTQPDLAEASAGNSMVDIKAVAIKRITVHGKIKDARTGAPVKANISFESPGTPLHTVSAGDDGYRADVLPSEYTIRIEAPGYISSLEQLDLQPRDGQPVEMNFNLQPVAVGATVNLKNVLFAQAKTDILPESYPELDLVVSFLKANPKVRIELMGHTDGRGVHADNVRLSQQRVNKVKEYLVSKGIEPRRISGKGFGGSRPIASNDTEESRRMNRRVEFVIKKF